MVAFCALLLLKGGREMKYFKKISFIAILGALPLVGLADEGENIYTKGGSQPQALAWC